MFKSPGGITDKNGQIAWLPGNNVLYDFLDFNVISSVKPDTNIELTENSDTLSLEVILSEPYAVEDNICIKKTTQLFATLNKKTGEVTEVLGRNIYDTLKSTNISSEINIYVFCLSVLFYKNKWAYEEIKKNWADFLERYTIKCLYFILYDLEFFEKIIKNQKQVVLTELPSIEPQEFIKKYKESGIPQSVFDKINQIKYVEDYGSDIPKNLSSIERVLKTIISTTQYITETEDGNNANLFVSWILSWTKLNNIKKSYLVELINSIESLIKVCNYNSKKLLDYLTRQSFNFGNFICPNREAQELLDYISIIKNRKTTSISDYPSNILKAHSCLVYDLRVVSDLETETLLKFQENSEKNAKKYSMVFKDYIVSVPQVPKDLVNEGISLSHCVACYAKRIANGDTIIAFLRKKESPDLSLYTLEIADDKVIQAKGAFDEAVPESIQKVISSLEKRWNRKEDLNV